MDNSINFNKTWFVDQIHNLPPIASLNTTLDVIDFVTAISLLNQHNFVQSDIVIPANAWATLRSKPEFHKSFIAQPYITAVRKGIQGKFLDMSILTDVWFHPSEKFLSDGVIFVIGTNPITQQYGVVHLRYALTC